MHQHTSAADPRLIDIAEYNYPLPDERIAKHPPHDRSDCKLLHRTAADGAIADHKFADLPDLLPADALLVYNNTRVINARLHFTKESGAAIEIFCLEPVAPSDYERSFAATDRCQWLCFVGNSKRWRQGDLTLRCEALNTTVHATRIDRRGNASVVEFSWDNPEVTFSRLIEALGEIPVPPYLNRDTEQSDSVDYQTVYSRIEGSVAAPTAGLHFTDEILDRISARGIERCEVTLHVGAGTFQPVKSDTVGEHEMHSEFITVSRKAIERVRANLGRIYAVGTTSVRTLESLYQIGCLIAAGQWNGEVPQWFAYSADHPNLTAEQALDTLLQWMQNEGIDRLAASTRIIIAPSYTYRVVNGLITNFHQPQSTLLLLVSAMIGSDWQRVYTHALDNGYRFLSYGDACLFD